MILKHCRKYLRFPVSNLSGKLFKRCGEPAMKVFPNIVQQVAWVTGILQ